MKDKKRVNSFLYVPKYAIEMMEPLGFKARYIHYLGKNMKCTEAYEYAEADFYKYFNKNRYSNYESFRNTVK